MPKYQERENVGSAALVWASHRTRRRGASCRAARASVSPLPPDLDCEEIGDCRFQVVGCDPQGFDGDSDGVGCESCN